MSPLERIYMIRKIVRCYVLGMTADEAAKTTGHCRKTTQKYFRMARSGAPDYLNKPLRYFITSVDERKKEVTEKKWDKVWKSLPNSVKRIKTIENNKYMFLTNDEFDKLKLGRIRKPKPKKEFKKHTNKIKFHTIHKSRYHYTSSYMAGSENHYIPGL